MGRTRRKNTHLPRRMYRPRPGGQFYFVDRRGEWHPLGTDYGAALTQYAKLIAKVPVAGTIAQLMEGYELDEFQKLAPATRAGRRQQFKMLLPVFGHVRPEHIEPHHAWTYYRDRGETEQAKKEVSGLSALLTYGRRTGALKKPNPCYGLRLSGAPERDRYVSDDEYLIVREPAPTMIGHAMDLALIAGLDVSTIIRLERRHITDAGLQFERRKTKKLQLIQWNDELRIVVQAILRERPQLRQFLICRRNGKPYTASGFHSIWQRHIRKLHKAGALAERFHFHDLRAKSGSDAESDKEAQDRLGHSDVEVTRRRYRRLPRRAVALRILDSGPRNI